jgi:hypothetical protein
MPSRFPRGATAYAKDGRSYVVEEVADGMVYCSSSNGAETEFPESALFTEAEWTAKTKGNGQHEISYPRLQQARHYISTPDKLDPKASDQMLAKADRLSPGILDFAAFLVASRILTEHKEQDLIPQLSLRKCRDVFNAARPDVRASLLAGILGARPDALVSAARLGDNLLKAMIAKGVEARGSEYEDFQDRPRR